MRRPVLLYDADCRLCRFTARAVRRLDRRGRLALLPLDAEEATPLLAGLPEEWRFASVRLAEPDGELLARGGAVARVLAYLGLPPVLVGGRLAVRLLDHGYGLIARNRARLGPLVPDGPAPRRFP